MGTIGTHNAAIIWRIINSHDSGMSEAEIKDASGLGVGTINRLVRTMATNGYLQRHEPMPGEVVRFTTLGTVDQVRASFCPPPPLDKNAYKQPSFFGDGIGRLNSVWALGAAS